MKSEHRHELAENELGKMLGRVLDEHLNKILWGLIVVGFAAAGVIFWVRASANQRSQAWTELASAQSAGEYEAVADDYPGTEAAAWARFRAADEYLRQGVMYSASDRPASDDRLAQAKQGYDHLLQDTTLPPEVREQALNGMAVTLETLSGSDTSEAVAAYEQLLKEFPNSRFKGWAEERIEALQTGRVQEFYAWFRSQKPRPADTPFPQDAGFSGDDPLGLSDPSNSLRDLLGTPPERVSEPMKDDDGNPFPRPLVGEEAPSAGDNPFPLPLSPSDSSDETPAENQPDAAGPDESASPKESAADETAQEQPHKDNPSGEPEPDADSSSDSAAEKPDTE